MKDNDEMRGKRDEFEEAHGVLMEAVSRYVEQLKKLEHADVYYSSTNPFDTKNAYTHYQEDHKWEDSEVVGMLLEHDSAFVSEMHDAEHEALVERDVERVEGYVEHKHGEEGVA